MPYVRLRRNQRLPYVAGCSASFTVRMRRAQSQFPSASASRNEFTEDRRDERPGGI